MLLPTTPTWRSWTEAGHHEVQGYASQHPTEGVARWRADATAWNSTTLMKEWLVWLNRRIWNRGKRAELYWKESDEDLTNALISWLPPKTTPRFQPMGQGLFEPGRLDGVKADQQRSGSEPPIQILTYKSHALNFIVKLIWTSLSCIYSCCIFCSFRLSHHITSIQLYILFAPSVCVCVPSFTGPTIRCSILSNIKNIGGKGRRWEGGGCGDRGGLLQLVGGGGVWFGNSGRSRAEDFGMCLLGSSSLAGLGWF